jgi:hypothetical protein
MANPQACAFIWTRGALMEGQAEPGLFHFGQLASEKFESARVRLNVLRMLQQFESDCRIALCVVLAERPVSPFFGITLRTGRETLTATSKKSRDQAESIFSKTQTQSMSLNRIISEQDAVSQAREAKTARLRELRLEKEAEEMAAAVALAALPKRAGKR